MQTAATVPSIRRASKVSRSHTIAVPGHSQRWKVVDSDESDTEVSPLKKVEMEDLDDRSADPITNPKLSDIPPPPEKKRGRGRPRKSDAAKLTSAVPLKEVHSSTKESMQRSEGLSATQDELLESRQEIDVAQINPSIPEPSSLGAERTATKTAVSPTKQSTPPPSTPEQPKQSSKAPLKTPESKTASKSPPNHSPISKGKVPFRVGLSKRARIAPLLKVMKK
jgi:hypothetical protein